MKSNIAPRSRFTFDAAQEKFKANPDKWGCRVEYLHAALEYWFDEMIGDQTLLAALHELRGG